MVRGAGLEPASLAALGPKPSAFANFANRATVCNLIYMDNARKSNGNARFP